MGKEQRTICAVASIVATAREMNEGCPAANSIEIAMYNVNQQLDASIDLIAVVAANAKDLPQGPGPALEWIAIVATQIARELRGGQSQ